MWLVHTHTYTYMQTHRTHADVGVLLDSSHYKAQATRSLQNGGGGASDGGNTVCVT